MQGVVNWVWISAAGVLLLASSVSTPLHGQLVGEDDPGAGLYYVPGLGPGDEFGRALAVLGDVDGDGVKDFAASGIAQREGPGTLLGHVDLLSGKTGALIRRWFGSRDYERLGAELGALPDIDADGLPELGVTDMLGGLTVFSPTTGEAWYTIPKHDDATIDRSATLLSTADQDGDGVGEFIFVDTHARFELGFDPGVGPRYARGRIFKVSTRRGNILWRWEPPVAEASVFWFSALVGDHDGDRVEDFLVTAEAPATGGGHSLLLFSGREGDLIERLQIRDDFGFWGIGMLPLGDHDGNGFPELLIAAPYVDRLPGDEVGWVGLYHLPDFELRWSYYGRHSGVHLDEWGDRLGLRLAAAGDADGDGAEDVLVGTYRAGSLVAYPRRGRLYLHSGRTGEVLMVYEANQGYDEESGGSVSSDLFFGTLSALDDIDGDGAIDFLTARPHNSQLVGPSLKGVVRAMRFRPGTPRFIRGDATANGRVDLADAVVIIQGLFTRSPPRCAIAHDADGDGTIELQDAAMILDYFFLSHRYEPSAPFPECGRYDMLHSHRRLGCADEGACSGG